MARYPIGGSVAAFQRLASLALLLALMAGLRSALATIGAVPDPVRSATVALGFLLLAAFIAGKLAAGIGLPRITGYILLGLLVGPDVLGLVRAADIAQLSLIDDIAISLIALAAGGELKMAELRSRGRSMTLIMVAEMAAVFAVVVAVVAALAGVLPFTRGRPTVEVAVIALILGSIAIANSPSVAIAVINDTRSRGPVTSTVLGVTVLKDVAVILFFAIGLSVARSVLAGGAGVDAAFFAELLFEIGGSILAGAVIGWGVAHYLRAVGAHMVLFTLAVAFLASHIAAALHLEVLLVSLSAGFFLENISPVHGEPFVEALEANSLPVYALFFALAGAGLHLDELARLWPFALLLVAARAVAIFAGTWAGARLARAEPVVRRYAWLGFVSQAGVTLGMVIIAARAFPEWGEQLRTLFVAMVAIHELVGPVLLQSGLRRAGEIGARGPRRSGVLEERVPAAEA
ncbi:MAG TPA: cation:proton antiporter [Longimicrobiales bacterium]